MTFKSPTTKRILLDDPMTGPFVERIEKPAKIIYSGYVFRAGFENYLYSTDSNIDLFLRYRIF